MDYTVRVSEQAAITMLLNGIEAYAIKKISPKGLMKENQLEVYGHLYGTKNVRSEDDTCYGIEYINIDTTAFQTKSSVTYADEAKVIKENIISAYWPTLSYLGSYHSHPYGSLEDVKKNKGFYASGIDRESMLESNEEVALILTIARLKRTHDAQAELRKNHTNCIKFSISNLRLWLTAYICSTDDDGGERVCSEDKPDNVILDCPSIFGMFWRHDSMCRIHRDGI